MKINSIKSPSHNNKSFGQLQKTTPKVMNFIVNKTLNNDIEALQRLKKCLKEVKETQKDNNLFHIRIIKGVDVFKGEFQPVVEVFDNLGCVFGQFHKGLYENANNKYVLPAALDNACDFASSLADEFSV